MRMRRSRVRTYHLRQRVSKKDSEGVPIVSYQESIPFSGEVWNASGKVQAEIYGERLSYICNCKIRGNYAVEQQPNGTLTYVFRDFCIQENDGVCVHVNAEENPDYKIIAIHPQKPLWLELERLI